MYIQHYSKVRVHNSFAGWYESNVCIGIVAQPDASALSVIDSTNYHMTTVRLRFAGASYANETKLLLWLLWQQQQRRRTRKQRHMIT